MNASEEKSKGKLENTFNWRKIKTLYDKICEMPPKQCLEEDIFSSTCQYLKKYIFSN